MQGGDHASDACSEQAKSGEPGFHECVARSVCTIPDCCASATSARLRSGWADYTIFTFAIRPSSGQYYLMHLARAPSCKRQGLRERHEGEPDPWDLAGPVLEAWGVRRGRRKPALFAFGALTSRPETHHRRSERSGR